ncbi:MAG: hypothetical protein HYS51_01165 [Candidatus Zambryskibacteria bacterium]|nr:hypothetical protein [Candidatus Zambryskibacteria bacterium]
MTLTHELRLELLVAVETVAHHADVPLNLTDAEGDTHSRPMADVLRDIRKFRRFGT